MESSSVVTDRLQLPKNCTCSAAPVPRTYEQLLRIRRNCLSAVYTIDTFTQIDYVGDATKLGYIQLNDGGNPQAIVTIEEVAGELHVTIVNTPLYKIIPKNPVSSVVMQTGAPGPTFTIVFASNSCCKCGN